MSVIRKKASVLSIIAENVSGVPQLPTNGSALPLRPDFSMSPEFESLENEELRNSLGSSKQELGAENPTASGSFYFRPADNASHEYADLYANIFGSNGSGTGASYVVDVGSTVRNIVMTSGISTPKGVCMLIKHPSSPWEIRPLKEAVGVNFELAFDLDVAPAAGTTISKWFYFPMSNELTGTLTLWYFHGNGGAVEMQKGVRCSEMTTTFSAGQYIDQSFSFEGVEYFFNPLSVLATDVAIDFDDGGGELNAVVTAAMYKDPYELMDAIAAAMNALTTDTITVEYSRVDGKVTFTSDGTTFELLFATGAGAANSIANVIGFAGDQTAALTYTGSALVWDAANYGMGDPNYSTKRVLVGKDNQLFIGLQDDNFCFNASEYSTTLALEIASISDVCAPSGISGKEATGRTVTASASQLLKKHEAGYFRQFREGMEISAAYIFGTKAGGNWVEGNSGCDYFPSATITSFSLTDSDNLVQLDIEIAAHVNETYDDEYVRSFTQTA